MNVEQRKAKIRWRCRRGMLELDILLERFVARALDSLSMVQLTQFETLLSKPDPDLYAWLMGYESPVRKELMDFVNFIRITNNT